MRVDDIHIKTNIASLARYSVVLTIIPSIYVSFFPAKIVAITILCSWPLMFLLLKRVSIMKRDFLEYKNVLYFYFFYGIIMLARGFLGAKSYDDWSALFSNVSIYLFLPLTLFFGVFTEALKNFFRTFIFIGMGMAFILLLKDTKGIMNFGHTSAPIYILLICTPFLKLKYRLVVFAFILISFLSNLSSRSNLINIVAAFMVMLTFYIRKLPWTIGLLKGARYFLLTAPIVFFILGVTGVFNIFQISTLLGEYVITSGSGKSRDLLVDSRTSIYTDVVLQLKEDGAYLFGLGASGKTKTSLVDIAYANFDVVYKDGRRATESGMLNFLQWGGAIGVIAYLLVFIKASYLGIYKSRNWLGVMMGVWVAYRALFSFIEDRLTFNLYSVFIFISIGMCLNARLRTMSEQEIQLYLNSFFTWKDKNKKIH